MDPFAFVPAEGVADGVAAGEAGSVPRASAGAKRTWTGRGPEADNRDVVQQQRNTDGSRTWSMSQQGRQPCGIAAGTGSDTTATTGVHP